MDDVKIDQKTIEKFWSKVNKTDTCWDWTAGKNTAGYGQFYCRYGTTTITAYAHRISYEITKGQIPKGLLIRHTCDNPTCVNPDHLLTGTVKDNSRDMIERGRSLKGKTRTHCRRGHEMNDENTFWNKYLNCRQCSICKKETTKAYKLAKGQPIQPDRPSRTYLPRVPSMVGQIGVSLPADHFVCNLCSSLTAVSQRGSKGFNRCKPCFLAERTRQRAENPEYYNAMTRKYRARKQAKE